jgi:tetratricopeptide (TPR) repeat protein
MPTDVLKRNFAGALLSPSTPATPGQSARGRDLLERAARKAEAVTENRDRTHKQAQEVLADLGRAAEVLHDAHDPEEARAFYLLASRLRYETGQHERTLALFDRSLALDPSSTDAWLEYLNYVTYIPNPDLMVADYRRMQPPARYACLSVLFQAASSLAKPDRELFLLSMSAAVDAGGDSVDVGLWFGDMGLREEKNGSTELALSWMRRAVSTGHARPEVADRLSIWLLKSGAVDAAAQALAVINHALSSSIESATVSDRLTKRKARCEKVIAS